MMVVIDLQTLYHGAFQSLFKPGVTDLPWYIGNWLQYIPEYNEILLWAVEQGADIQAAHSPRPPTQ